jgi:predicted amidohydrolase
MRVAAAQAHPVWLDKAATTERVVSWIELAAKDGVDLLAFPETFLPGYVAGDVVTVEGRTLARVSRSVREGGASVMEVHYVVADAATPARHFTVTHVNTLFTREQYEDAFTEAKLRVDYLEGGPSGRGLFAGTLG